MANRELGGGLWEQRAALPLFEKPTDPGELRGAIAEAIERHRLLTSERVLLEETLFGSIHAMLDLLGAVPPEDDLLGNIPRLEPVLGSIPHLEPIEARILKLARDYDTLRARGLLEPKDCLEEMRAHTGAGAGGKERAHPDWL